MITGSLKNVINKMSLQIIYLKYMYKEDLALNNLQWLICHESQLNQSPLVRIPIVIMKILINVKSKIKVLENR